MTNLHIKRLEQCARHRISPTCYHLDPITTTAYTYQLNACEIIADAVTRKSPNTIILR